MRPSRILIVEDEIIVAMDIERRLSLLGYEPLGSVSTGTEALAKIDQLRPDLVLMDIELPGGMDGIQVAEAINRPSKPPVVFLTAYSEDTTLARARLSNVFGYVLKPFDDGDLKTIIEMALYKHSTEQEIRRLTRIYATLSEINQAVVRLHSRQMILDQVCRVAVESGGFKMAWAGWLDPVSDQLSVVSVFGDIQQFIDTKFAVDDSEHQGMAAGAMSSGKPFIIDDVASDDRAALWREAALKSGFCAAAAFPITSEGQVRGTLAVYSEEKQIFRGKEVSLLEEIAMDISFAIDKLDEESRRRHAEELLRDSSQFYQQIIASAWEGIIVCDLNLACLVWNPAMEALTGIKAGKVVGRNPADVLPLLRDEGVIDHMQAVLAGKMLPTLELAYKIPETGRSGWISHTSAPLRDTSGNLVGVVAMVHDISQRMRAEQQAESSTHQLRISEARYRRLVEFCPDAVLIHCEGKIDYINPAGLRLLGAEGTDQVFGLPILEIIAPDCRDAVCERINLLTSGEVSSLPMVEETLMRLDGGTIEADVSRTVFKLGEKTAILVMAHDISLRKMMEARFLRDQRIETIGALASGIAHDLNNVLSPITMTVALLRDKCGDDPDTLALIGAMEASAHRGAGVIQQLLTFGRGATGQHALLHPKHLLKELSDLSREIFPKSIAVTCECRTKDWLVMGDATQLHQVLLNLCVNARDAMPNGGELDMFLDFQNIDQRYALRNPEAKPGPYVVFSVRDTGKGIPVSIQPKIFEPFFTTKDVGKGTGLGLATVLNLVKKHKGFIEWESTEGKGSLFKVYLPATPAASAADIPYPQTYAYPSGNGELILVVDDEESIRRIMRMALEKNGYRVMTANDGAEALDVYRDNFRGIHAVLIDVMMPIMGGPTAMRKMREINPDVLLIATSGMIPKELEADLEESKPKRFLAKPFTSGQLLETLAAALSQ